MISFVGWYVSIIGFKLLEPRYLIDGMVAYATSKMADQAWLDAIIAGTAKLKNALQRSPPMDMSPMWIGEMWFKNIALQDDYTDCYLMGAYWSNLIIFCLAT